MNLLVSMFLAFLPKRYRESLTPHAAPPSGAVLGGILETLTGLGLLIHGYQSFATERLAALPASVLMKAGEKGGESAIMGFGSILLLEYVFQFTTIVLLFLTVEGAVRAIAAVGSGEVLPSLPLQALAFLQGKLQARGREIQLGKRIRDEVQFTPDEEFMQIASCRPKSWTQLTTISYEDEFYQLITTKVGPAPRRFVYILRKKPVSGVIRGLYRYHPDEALND
jgi:hypothetical protein